MSEWKKARKEPVEVEYRGPYTDPEVIETIEGDFEVDEEYIEEHGGFVIIRGVDGEVYPCALDIFEETYTTSEHKHDWYPVGETVPLIQDYEKVGIMVVWACECGEVKKVNHIYEGSQDE